MNDQKVDQWETELSIDMIRRAYVCGDEFAWPKADAIQVVQLLKSKGYRILGVDPWVPTARGPTPLIHDWDESYAISAVEFIETFVWTPLDPRNVGLELHFNLTVGERENEV